MMKSLLWSLAVASSFATVSAVAAEPHSFTLGTNDFLLDGQPLQIRAGELHPERIPPEYWRHRIQMAKAMGLNALGVYVFWNAHEREEGRFDFTSPGLDVGQFLRIAKEEQMWVLLRPGPYCCGEWDFGGIPTYLLRYPDLKLRTLADAHYTNAVARYFHELAQVVRPHLAADGGAILMVQIENEYGSYPRRDHAYVEWLRELWMKEGINGPFYTADGAGENYLKDVTLPGAAVGLDTGENENHWALARRMNPGVPVFSSECYPGWLRHWGEGDWAPTDISRLVRFYMEKKKSFGLYMLHGGSNFGFTAGANSGGKGYEPDLTSYDYGAPVDEQGRATPAYHALRKQIAAYFSGKTFAEVPAPIPTIALPDIKLERWSGVWEHFSAPKSASQPECFEVLGQNQGLMLYRTTIAAGPARRLTFANLHDYGQVFVDGTLIGTLDRRLGQRQLELPECPKAARLDILVEGMGHINFTLAMESDRKGLYGEVKLGGLTLTNWQMFPLPLTEKWVTALPKTAPAAGGAGGIFKGHFKLDRVADTYLDLSRWKKGVVWVNGHNLGRFWHIGPQQRLYCPAPWLKSGDNELMVLDLVQSEPAPIAGFKSARGVADPLEGLSVKQQENSAFEINVPAHTVYTKDIAWPAGATTVAAQLNPMQDAGQAWGVGLALGWSDGRYVQVNARVEGRWGIRHNGQETLAGGFPKSTASTVVIKLEERVVRLLARPEGAEDWVLLAEFPRPDFSGAPTTVRIGKIGATWQPQNYSDKGSTSPCRVDWVKVY